MVAEMELRLEDITRSGPGRLRRRSQPGPRAGRHSRPHPPGQCREEAAKVLRAGCGRGPAMTEAAPRQVAKPPRRMSAATAVVWTGLALGTFLAAEALTHDVM